MAASLAERMAAMRTKVEDLADLMAVCLAERTDPVLLSKVES